MGIFLIGALSVVLICFVVYVVASVRLERSSQEGEQK